MILEAVVMGRRLSEADMKKKRVMVGERARAYDEAPAPTTGLIYAPADAMAQSFADSLDTPVDIVIHGMVKISRKPQKAA